MSVRVGLNVHPKARGGADWSAAEKTYFPAFLEQLNPSAIVQMGYGRSEFDTALAWRELLENTTVIYRQYHDAEGHLFELLKPYDYITGMKLYTDPRIPLYILNETNSKAPLDELKRNIQWRVEVMRILALEGQPHVIGNEGPGQPHMSWFSDDAKWEIVHPFFQQFKMNPFSAWGLHPYWGNNGLRPSEGQSARHRDIATALALRETSMPPVYLTEVGRDRYGDSKVNGWRSTGVTEEVFAAEIVEAQNTLWNEPYIRGAMVYCYGSTKKEWFQFDIMYAGLIHKAMIAANKQPTDIPPPPPVESWATGVAKTGLDGVVLRFQPNTTSKTLAVIYNGDLLSYKRSGAVDGWLHVRKGNVTGYASEQFLQITAGELPAPNHDTKPIPLPPAPTQAELNLQRASELWTERRELEAKLATNAAELDELLCSA